MYTDRKKIYDKLLLIIISFISQKLALFYCNWHLSLRNPTSNYFKEFSSIFVYIDVQLD